MRKFSHFLIGFALGALGAAIIAYLFGPSNDTEFNQNYRSRLDHAFEEGEKAAQEREAALYRQFEEAKIAKPDNGAAGSV